MSGSSSRPANVAAWVWSSLTESGGVAIRELVRDDATRDTEPRFWLQRSDDLHACEVAAGKASVVRVESSTPGHYSVRGSAEGMT